MSRPLKAKKCRPGDWVAEKNAIFIGEFNDLARADIPAPLANTANLGLRTRWYDAALDLAPETFDDFVKTVSQINRNGRCGVFLDPARYEENLFEKLRSREALGKLAIAPLAVIDAIHELKNQGEYKRRQDGNLPGKLRVDGGGTGYDRWQWSSSQGRYGADYVRIVDFTDGYHGWDFRKGNRLSGRACFAELVDEGDPIGCESKSGTCKAGCCGSR